MKIIALLKQLYERFPTETEQQRMAENFFRKREELRLCDLDLALLFIGMTMHFEAIDARPFLFERTAFIDALVDSSYARFFAPAFFENDMTSINEEERKKELREAVEQSIREGKGAKGLTDAVDNHELLSDFDIRLLDVAKSNVVNVSECMKIELHGNRVYSFALSQTKFKIFSDLVLTNLGEKEIKDAKLVFLADPGYLEISDIAVPLINPSQPVAITEFDVTPHLEQLMELGEKILGALTVKLFVGEEELASLTTEISYFSYDTWLEYAMSGSSALFVTPNEISVQNIVGFVAKELQGLIGSSSLPGYQLGDKNHVVSQLKALYNTLHKEAIAYISAPPSYEAVGQKIRLPHDVLIHKQGTCLDLTLLFIACAERMDLNPFLVLIKGHAFAGVFLEEGSFPTMIYDDAPHALEMNSEEENDILFIECTAFTADNAASFEQGLRQAARRFFDHRSRLRDHRHQARPRLGFLAAPD